MFEGLRLWHLGVMLRTGETLYHLVVGAIDLRMSIATVNRAYSPA